MSYSENMAESEGPEVRTELKPIFDRMEDIQGQMGDLLMQLDRWRKLAADRNDLGSSMVMDFIHLRINVERDRVINTQSEIVKI